MQAMSLLEAFNKDRALMPQPLANPPPLAPLPTLVLLPPDARTQEMIKEKLKRAEELGELGMVDEAQKAMEEAEALKKLGARQETSADPAKLLAPDVRIVRASHSPQTFLDMCSFFLVYLILRQCKHQTVLMVAKDFLFADGPEASSM
jgi:hypothetical protein